MRKIGDNYKRETAKTKLSETANFRFVNPKNAKIWTMFAESARKIQENRK